MSRSVYCVGLAVCILISGMGAPVRADDPPGDDVAASEPARRPVAVIELGDFEPNRQLADQLASELNNSQVLKPLDSSILVNALREDHRDEDAQPIKDAADEKAVAEENVINYKFPEAARAADNGLVRLHFARPSPKTNALAADLAFLLGAARLGTRDDVGAVKAFRFVRAIDPSYKPDAGRYLREIVQAFESAVRIVPPGKGYIYVGPGPGRVFLDGREVGTSPQTFPDITPGMHVVWLVGDQRDTNARRVEVVAGQKVDAVFDPEQIDVRKTIKRARLALKTAPDPAVRAAKMQALARLLEVKDAILLTEANGKTIVQTWRDAPVAFGTPGFSALRERTDKDRPADILTPLIPPKITPPPRKPEPPIKPPVVVDTRRWYQKPRYQIAGGVGAVVLGVVIYSLASWERSLKSNPDLGFDTRRDR